MSNKKYHIKDLRDRISRKSVKSSIEIVITIPQTNRKKVKRKEETSQENMKQVDWKFSIEN